MSAEWRTVSLGEIAADVTVGHVGPMTSEYVNNGVPFLRSKNIEPYRVCRDDLKFISADFHARIKKSCLHAGDVVIVRTGKPGTACVISQELDNSNCSDLVIVRPGKLLDSHYLAYYMNSVAVAHVNAYTVGAVQQHFNVSSAKQVSLRLPPIDEQRAIVSILKTIDDKIDLNRRMSETLEAMARAIFQSWFVDFDPVHAKAEGRQPWGMDSNTVTLFPERLVAGIPAGWVVEKIGAVTAINQSSIGRDWPHDEIEYVDIASVSEGHLSGTSKLTLSEAPSRAKRCVTHGDTIWSCVRPNRRSFLFINKPSSNTVVSTGFAVLSPVKVTPSYLYLWTTTQEFTDYLTANADGSAYPAVRPEHFASAEILVPPKSLLGSFEQMVAPCRDMIHHNLDENRTLADLRDALLPKLMSGEIHIKEAEQKIEEEIA